MSEKHEQQPELRSLREEIIANAEAWRAMPAEAARDYYVRVKNAYFGVANDYMALANAMATEYHDLSNKHLCWRKRLIIATGFLAGINILGAASFLNAVSIDLFGNSVTISSILSVASALWAGAIAVFANIENLHRYGERAAGFREARELLLDQYRDCYFNWQCQAEPLGETPSGSESAARLCVRLVEADKVLRQKLKRLTEAKPEGGPSATPSAASTK